MNQYVESFQHYASDYVSNSYLLLILAAFLVILFSQLLAWLASRSLRRLLKEAEKTANIWDDIVVEAALRPVSMAIRIAGALLAIVIITADIENEILQAIVANTYVIFIPLCAWFLSNTVKVYERKYIAQALAENKQPDRTTIQAITRLIRLSIIIVTILLIMQNLGINITGLVAAGGVGGLAIGFAAQDLLANFFGGLMLYLEKPFKVGDWVRSPDREIEGTVTEIGLRSTAILTFDYRPIYVPNSIFTKIVIENPSRMSNRRIYEIIGVRYDDIGKIEKILENIRQELIDNQDIDTNHTNMVNFNSFAPSSLDIMLYCFTFTKNWEKYHQIKEKLLLRIGAIIEQQGAQVAYPTTTVHLEPSIPEEQPETKLQ